MEHKTEQRGEQRLCYHWPVWFAEDLNESLSQGQMADVSSAAAAFTCCADDNCPRPGERITTQFSVPRFDEVDSFDMANFTRTGHICRVDDVNNYVRRVAIQFAEPLPFKPGEQPGGTPDIQ